jgi:hypothetical protein
MQAGLHSRSHVAGAACRRSSSGGRQSEPRRHVPSTPKGQALPAAATIAAASKSSFFCAFTLRAHIFRRQQADLVSLSGKPPAQMVHAAARLHRHNATPETRDKAPQRAPPHPTSQNNPAKASQQGCKSSCQDQSLPRSIPTITMSIGPFLSLSNQSRSQPIPARGAGHPIIRSKPIRESPAISQQSSVYVSGSMQLDASIKRLCSV